MKVKTRSVHVTDDPPKNVSDATHADGVSRSLCSGKSSFDTVKGWLWKSRRYRGRPSAEVDVSGTSF